MKWQFTTCAVAAILVFGSVRQAWAALAIVSKDRSDYSIVVPARAPASVNAAAVEMQRDIAQSTGVKLPIVKDNQFVSGPAINLGSTRQAEAAGLSAEGISDGGFRILTRGGNLYIIGLDTAAIFTTDRPWLPYDRQIPQPDIPGPQFTRDGGFSNGTANGVYTFLEDYLGVRWLMPGALGRDVPARDGLKIDDLDRTEAPAFIYRAMSHLDVTPAIARWQDRMKLGYSFRIDYTHNWIKTVPLEMYKTHPEWFAMIDGKRPPPPRRWAKLETTNPDVVKFFAQKATAYLKSHPRANTFSLSPSDGRGWSESPASMAFYDPKPEGSSFVSVTPLILKWYRDVSRIVARQYPRGKLAGFIYADYLFPPRKGGMSLPDNFIPVIAPSFDYGYRLYRQDVRRTFDEVLSGWAKVVPSTWFYFDLPNTLFHNDSGLLTPPATDILNFIFPRLLKYHIKGAVHFYGSGSWSQAAMTNYIGARMLWDPTLDAASLQKEWLVRAYGPRAGAVMERLYRKLDGWFADYYKGDPKARYLVTPEMMKEVFGDHYSELEPLFLRAAAQPMTSLQKQRLELIQDNMIVLRWRLRNAGILPEGQSSPLERTDEQIAALLVQPHSDFPHFPRALVERRPPPKIQPTIIQLDEAQTRPGANEQIRNSDYVLLYAARSAPVRLKVTKARPNGAFLSYSIHELNARGAPRVVRSGMLYAGESIEFPARAASSYYLRIASTGTYVAVPVEYAISIADAAVAKGRFHNGILHLVGDEASLHVYVPDKLSLHCANRSSGVLLQASAEAQGGSQVFP